MKKWVSKKGCWTKWGQWTQRSWRQVLIDTQVTSHWLLTSSSLVGVGWWRLGRFPSAVIEVGMRAQVWLPNCTLEDFAGHLQYFEGDIYKKQQFPLRDKLSRKERCCFPQRHSTPAACLPLSFCQQANLGKKDVVWHISLASYWTLHETVASCNKQSFRTLSFYPGCNSPAVTAPDDIVPLLTSCATTCISLSDGELCLFWSLPEASSCFLAHLLSFQLWSSLVC